MRERERTFPEIRGVPPPPQKDGGDDARGRTCSRNRMNTLFYDRPACARRIPLRLPIHGFVSVFSVADARCRRPGGEVLTLISPRAVSRGFPSARSLPFEEPLLTMILYDLLRAHLRHGVSETKAAHHPPVVGPSMATQRIIPGSDSAGSLSTPRFSSLPTKNSDSRLTASFATSV